MRYKLKKKLITTNRESAVTMFTGIVRFTGTNILGRNYTFFLILILEIVIRFKILNFVNK